ncbi:aquaporin [Gautieria morchelliformis]|nr:aquaporin [Gautieria morchelliformis]
MASNGKAHQTPSKEEIKDVDLPESRTVHTNDVVKGNLTIHYTLCPNKWARWRRRIREPAAEFLGTMVLVLFGNGVVCQVILGSNPAVAAAPKGDYLSISFGWAVAAALGVWVCGGISGGHINPAVTLSLAVFRRFPWKKVPVYMFAQLMGALCGAACVYATYFHAIDIVEGGRGIRTVPGTASLFATYALPYMTSASCFFNEFLGTALLLIVVLAVTDKGNLSPPQGMLPLVLFFTVFGIGASFGMQTGYAINPARDLGPRLLTAMVGYGGQVFTFRSQYWLWCAILGPFSGALVGSLVYDAFVFVGSESILNIPNATARAHHERARRSARDKIPAGIDVV